MVRNIFTDHGVMTVIGCTALLLIIVFFLQNYHPAVVDTAGSTSIHLPAMPTASTSTMKIGSSAFAEGGTIPGKYTCDGEGISIPLTFSGVPKGTRSLTLFLEDPDTSIGIFTHWVVFNIPATTTSVIEEMPKTTPTFGTAGKNGAGTNEYLGPCPPNGTHRYIFTLFALDVELPLQAGASKEDVIKAMEGHLVAKTTLQGMYGR